MRIAAEELYWHDAAVDAAHYDESARRLTWQVEVVRWEITPRGNAQPGQLIFEGVQHIEPLYDVVDKPSPEPWWGVLQGVFERTEGLLRCRFSLELPNRTTGLNGSGYGELIVTCQNAWYTPTHSP